MVTPELPTRIPIGHPVFHDNPDRQGHDSVGVMASRRSDIGQIRTEVLATGFAIMLRVGDVQLAGSSGHQVTDIVQRSGEHMLAGSWLATPRARALRFHARLFRDLGFRQVFEAGVRHIRPILAGSNFGGGAGGSFLHASSLPQIARLGIFVGRCATVSDFRLNKAKTSVRACDPPYLTNELRPALVGLVALGFSRSR
jgi:hypothetical protein